MSESMYDFCISIPSLRYTPIISRPEIVPHFILNFGAHRKIDSDHHTSECSGLLRHVI